MHSPLWNLSLATSLVYGALKGQGMASNEDYRNLAAECLRIAHENQTPKNRAVLLRMAEIWSRMADRAEVGSADEIDLSLTVTTIRAAPRAPEGAQIGLPEIYD